MGARRCSNLLRKVPLKPARAHHPRPPPASDASRRHEADLAHPTDSDTQPRAAYPPDKKAALVLTGATSRDDFESKVRALGASYNLERVDFVKPRPANLHGIDVLMYEDEAAVSNGQPADVLVLLADAPNGKGVVIVFVMAWDTTQAHDQRIIDAANTLRPM